MTPPPISPLGTKIELNRPISTKLTNGLTSKDDPQLAIWYWNWLFVYTKYREPFLLKGEKIVYTKPVIKRVRLSAKKRQLILTDKPRLIYIDPVSMEQKGEIPWSDDIIVQKKSEKDFIIKTVISLMYNITFSIAKPVICFRGYSLECWWMDKTDPRNIEEKEHQSSHKWIGICRCSVNKNCICIK